MEPIQSHCILKQLPALSCLVVGEKTGLPGEGFIAAADVPAEQARVFAYAWLESPVPDAESLEEVTRRLPSNGRSLTELLAQVKAG